MRRPLIAGNWKMHVLPSETSDFATRLRVALEPFRSALENDVEVALAPAFPLLGSLGQALVDSDIALAAQNVHAETSGAFTGEVSVSMLEDLGCRYALIGHSERRQIYGESDADVAAKAARIAESTLAPILCIGETLEEYEAGRTADVVRRQLECVLEKAGDGLGARLVVAYEPVWAIGTGRTATPEIAQNVHASIRETLITRLGTTGGETRILYGGSVKPSNARELLAQPDVDGALVGGASLDPEAFAEICLSALPSLEKL
jgi:triosephosphate isomerase